MPTQLLRYALQDILRYKHLASLLHSQRSIIKLKPDKNQATKPQSHNKRDSQPQLDYSSFVTVMMWSAIGISLNRCHLLIFNLHENGGAGKHQIRSVRMRCMYPLAQQSRQTTTKGTIPCYHLSSIDTPAISSVIFSRGAACYCTKKKRQSEKPYLWHQNHFFTNNQSPPAAIISTTTTTPSRSIHRTHFYRLRYCCCGVRFGIYSIARSFYTRKRQRRNIIIGEAEEILYW